MIGISQVRDHVSGLHARMEVTGPVRRNVVKRVWNECKDEIEHAHAFNAIRKEMEGTHMSCYGAGVCR